MWLTWARGKERSNSYDLLSQFGWRGILIEANPALIPSIKVAFANLDAQVIQCAISDYSGMAILHLGVNDDVSSLQPDYAAGWGQIQGKQEVAVRRLGDLLLEQNIPLDFDLLSLDIEGEDIKVLNDTIGTFHYRPRWIIIEASFDFSTTSLSQQPFSPLVRGLYKIVEQTRANLVLGMIDR